MGVVHKIIVLSLIFLFSLHSAQAILFLQEQIDISDNYFAEQTTIITILNDEPTTRNIELFIERDSLYLNEYVDLEPTKITLFPNEKENIQITTSFPEDLSPEKHTLSIRAQTEEQDKGSITSISFTVPGIASPKLEITNETTDLDRDDKTITIELENTGNVIMRPVPNLIILDGERTVKEIPYKNYLQLLPGDSYPLTLRYDSSLLEPGTYSIQAVFTGKESNIQTKRYKFTVEEESSEQLLESTNYNFIIIGGFAFIIIGYAFYYIRKEEQRRKLSKNPIYYKLAILEKREKHIEHQLHKLSRETHKVVHSTNKWIRKNVGEQYELK